MTRICAFGGGKGGVGKSFLTASIGALFAKQGWRVILVDLDLGGSNLHTFMGIRDPKTGIHDFLNRTVEDLSSAALPTSIPNLSIICSMNCPLEIANLFHAQKLKLKNAIQKLPYDYVLLDLGAGTNFNTLDFFLTSNEGIFVFTPEPTAIENTLRFIKAIYYRRLKQVLKQRTFNSIVKRFIDESGDATINLNEIIEFIVTHDQGKGTLLQSKLDEFKFSFILNEFRRHNSPNLGEKIQNVCNRHFYSTFHFLGNVSYDERVHDSVFTKQIYVKKYPYTRAATDLQNIAAKIAAPTQDTVPINVTSS